jgi:hypothetical protein
MRAKLPDPAWLESGAASLRARVFNQEQVLLCVHQFVADGVFGFGAYGSLDIYEFL